MTNKFDESLIQYYEFELEKKLPRGAEENNEYLPIIGEIVVGLTQNADSLDDGSACSVAWRSHSQNESSIVYFHKLTGWSVLLTWNGLHGVEGHSMQYFNHVHFNPGVLRTRDFQGSMDVVQTYQTWAMRPERPFWDLVSAVVERGEQSDLLSEADYSNILERLEHGFKKADN